MDSSQSYSFDSSFQDFSFVNFRDLAKVASLKRKGTEPGPLERAMAAKNSGGSGKDDSTDRSGSNK